MNDIQKARDVLAKWREDATPGPWIMEDAPIKSMGFSVHNGLEGVVREAYEESDTRLIVGTAGNPALLDAIDGLLHFALINESVGVVQPFADRIAAAIIAADDRMQQ